MTFCPLKEASKTAPNEYAIYSREKNYTFAELDRLADSLNPALHQTATPTAFFIASLFAAWRKNKSLFALNPKNPPPPPITTKVPPRSLLLMTSGTTGSPKIAVLSMTALLTNAKNTRIDLAPGDLWKLTLPLYHVGGIGIVLRCILAKAAMCLDDHPDITHLSCVPTHLYRASPTYKKLKCLLLGGAPIVHIPPNLPIYTTYGLTEMGSMVTLNGCVLPNRELKLGYDGEILVKGPCLFTQYLGEPMQQGWFATKDLGEWKDGKLLIKGRKDRMFISGGENIQPEEIERHLEQMDGILQVAVAAKDDAEFGKRPAAVIVTKKEISLLDVHRFLSDKLPKFKWPIQLYFTNQIPQTPLGKINRFIVSQLINNKQDKNIAGQKKRPCL